ncbi:nucleoside diphosphate kinase homolog 5-like [Clytia hemisphaerica]
MEIASSYIHVEQTLAIIKPDAIENASEIEERVLNEGFTILQTRRVHLTPEQTSEFYVEHYGKMFFPSLVAFMSSGDILAMILARKNGIKHWRSVIGPTQTSKARDEAPDSLRALYGTDNQRNAVHGSDSPDSALREIHFFFPNAILEPLPTSTEAKDYLTRDVNPTLLQGLTELCKRKPTDPLIWLSDWLAENNPNKPIIREPGEITEPSSD